MPLRCAVQAAALAVRSLALSTVNHTWYSFAGWSSVGRYRARLVESKSRTPGSSPGRGNDGDHRRYSATSNATTGRSGEPGLIYVTKVCTMVLTPGSVPTSDPPFPDLSLEEVRRLIAESGIPEERLREAAELVYAWEQGDEFDEPDARVLVIMIVETVGYRCQSKESTKDESGESRKP